MVTNLSYQSRRAIPRDWVASKVAVHEDCDLVNMFRYLSAALGFPTSVRGSFSARVPRSSFARVRRVLVSHREEESEEQENEKDDKREDGKQRVEGRVVENQNNHIMSA